MRFNTNKKLPDLNFLENKSILITGGTGTFGKQLVKVLVNHSKVARIVIFSRDEFKQYQMEQEFPHSQYPMLRFFIGDVRDQQRLTMALAGIDYVFHAAAIKHVPIAEYNPFECIKTNVIGAENVVTACIAAGVKKVIALSTDKAVSPINLYGASKLASDKIFVAANHLGKPQGTIFAVVRYGNVVGSRGSVIPYFQRLINDGEVSLPITDERMTRFFITTEEGVYFSLSSLEIMRGGEVFVPKLPSARITDIARLMLPEGEHKKIGMRPGEKLHEAMISEGDAATSVELEDRYIIESNIRSSDHFSYLAHGAKPVQEGFCYSSNLNDDWLGDSELLDLINSATKEAK